MYKYISSCYKYLRFLSSGVDTFNYNFGTCLLGMQDLF
jgi:hypothetical protein